MGKQQHLKLMRQAARNGNGNGNGHQPPNQDASQEQPQGPLVSFPALYNAFSNVAGASAQLQACQQQAGPLSRAVCQKQQDALNLTLAHASTLMDLYIEERALGMFKVMQGNMAAMVQGLGLSFIPAQESGQISGQPEEPTPEEPA